MCIRDRAETFLLEHLPAFSLKNAVLTALLAILGALVSILFCIVLHQTDHLYKKFFPNPVSYTHLPPIKFGRKNTVLKKLVPLNFLVNNNAMQNANTFTVITEITVNAAVTQNE